MAIRAGRRGRVRAHLRDCAVLIRGFGPPYMPAQILTTGIVLFWSFAANTLWTFSGPPIPPVP